MSGSRFTMSRDRLAELRVSFLFFYIMLHELTFVGFDRDQIITKKDMGKSRHVYIIACRDE
jgi:hypothetical protein